MYNGSNYIPGRDKSRLDAQMQRVFNLMKDGAWRGLHDISAVTNDPPASVSAQLRHLRKPRFGAHTVNKRYLGSGLYHYQLVLNNGSEEDPGKALRELWRVD